MSFLEKAREYPMERPATAYERAEQDYWFKNGKKLHFMEKCWPELLAVVEAAQAGHVKAHFRGIDERGFLYENTPLGDALDALDKKAGE